MLRSYRTRIVAALAVVAAVVLTPLGAASAAAGGHLYDDRRLPAGFTEQRMPAGSIRLNYVRGGHGPVLVLLHGFPETWYTWRKVMPELARHYTVIAPDLPGAGGSDAPAGGYDKKTMAAAVHALLARLGLDHDIRLVGHDIGTMVAYAYASAHPGDVRKLVLSEAPIPDLGIYTFPALKASGPAAWNFGFFSLSNGLPERLVDGREELWVQLFTDSLEMQKDGIGPAEVREFASYLRDDAHLTASFAWFRAFPQDIDDNAVYAQTRLTMPVLAIGAKGSLAEAVPDQVRRYATNVTGVVIQDSGHWLYEEQPAEMDRVLLNFLG